MQPNYCDCGIYLLHFARTFAGNHEHYSSIIRVRLPSLSTILVLTCCLQTRLSSQSHPERQTDWDGEHLEGFRETLMKRIRQLSREWKASKEEKANAQALEVADPSDDEVDIVEATPPTLKGKGRGKAKEVNGKATRANRIRGD